MDLLISRLHPLIVAMADGFPTDPFIAKLDRSKLQWIVGTSEQILNSFQRPRHYE